MPGVPPKAGRLVVPRQTTGHPEKVAAGPFDVASLSGGFLAGACRRAACPSTRESHHNASNLLRLKTCSEERDVSIKLLRRYISEGKSPATDSATRSS
jgi:hypothetical protein